MEDREETKKYAHYTEFKIGPENTGYVLRVLKGYSGDAGDSLTTHFNQTFSTYDLDYSFHKCATERRMFYTRYSWVS